MLGSSVVSVLLAVILLLLRNNLGYLFTDSSSVAKKVSELAPFLAATIILNGLQLVLSGTNLTSSLDLPSQTNTKDLKNQVLLLVLDGNPMLRMQIFYHATR